MTSGDPRTSAGKPSASARRLGRDGAYGLAALAVFAGSFAVAFGTGQGVFAAATFAFAAVAAFAGVTVLLGVRARDRRAELIARDLRELAETQRGALADAAGGKPEPRVLFLHENAGVQRARIERRRPRPLDIEETVAHERTLALRTLTPAKAPRAGSLKIYREPTDDDRDGFRETVERYAATLREALQEYEDYRKERALLVGGRFRFENLGRRSAHNVTVRAYFPDPFEIVQELSERPVLPKRPTFRGKRAGLAALLGGDSRPGAPPNVSVLSREARAVGADGNVSRPRYRQGSAIVEVSVEQLQHSLPADMADGDHWLLRLAHPGEYRIQWEVLSDELEEPARGVLWIEVAELFDSTPIRSIKELLSENLEDASEPDVV